MGAGPSGPAPFCQPSLSSVLGWAWTARGRPALLVPSSGLSPAGHYANDFSTGLGARGARGDQAGREPGVSLTPLRTANEGVGVPLPFVLVWAKRGAESSDTGRVLAPSLLGGKTVVIERRGKKKKKRRSHAEGAREKAHGLRRPEGNTQLPLPKKDRTPTPGAALGCMPLPPSVAEVCMRQPWVGLHQDGDTP